MGKNKSFVFYESFYNSVESIEDKSVKADIYKLVCSYGLYGKCVEDDLNQLSKVVFNLIKPLIDNNKARYNACVENGKKGGNPNFEKGKPNLYYKKDNLDITKTLPKDNQKITKDITKRLPIDNLNVYVNDNDNVYVNDNVNDINNIDNTSIIFHLPLIDNTNYDVSEQQIETYKQLYPAIDIEQEFRKMLGWLDANSKNRKTRNGIKRFINGWLSKAQDKAPKVDYAPKVDVKEKVVEDNDELTIEEMERMVAEFNAR